jgi:hypothetical protein
VAIGAVRMCNEMRKESDRKKAEEHPILHEGIQGSGSSDSAQANQNPTQEWTWCDPPDPNTGTAGFRILWPASTCSPTTSSAQSAVGNVMMHQATTTRASGAAYMISWADYPPSFAGANPSGALLGAQNGAIQAMKGQLVETRSTHIGRLPCQEFSFVTGRFAGRFRMCLSGARIYSVGVLLPPEAAEDVDASRFLESLAIRS